MSRRSMRAAALTVALGAGVAVVPAAAGNAAAAGGKPDLRVSKVGAAPATLAEGTTFAVRDTVRNAGRGGAPATTVRFYLTTDPARSLRERKASKDDPRSSPTDILLTGARELRALTGGASSAAGKPTRLVVPGGTPAGRYVLLACADDRGAAKERREHDNCRAAKQPAQVTAGGDGEIVSHGRLAPPLSAEEEAVVPLSVKQDWCTTTRYRRITVAEAVKRVTAELKKVAGADAIAAFKASPAYKSADAAELAAAEALAQSQPGAALAAMLRAHQLAPREASHLLNAAALASGVGLPNEALGMLDQAARLDDPDSTPMGIPRAAMFQAVRAQALVRVGKYAQARTAAAAATQLAPMLTEPHGAQAAAALCEGRDMLPAYRRAQKRQSSMPPRTPPHPIPPDTPWVDDSTGVPGTYSEFTLPGSPMDAPYLAGVYRGKIEAEGPRIMARNAREQQLREALAAKQDSEATVEARSEIFDVINKIGDAPDLRALAGRFSDEISAARAERDALIVDGDVSGRALVFLNESREACMGADDFERCVTDATRSKCIGVTGGAHSVWLSHLNAATDIAKEYQREYGRRVSGTAAHLSDNSAYELGLMVIADKDFGMRGLVLQEASAWTGALDALQDSRGIHYCIATPNPVPPPVHTPDGVPAGPGACNDWVQDMNLVVPLPGGSAFKVSCESLAVELAGETWITGFAEFKLNFRSQKFSVFAGSKLEIGWGPMKADFKSGVYFEAGPSGVEDFGLRAGPSRTLTGKYLEWNPSKTVDISVMELFVDKPKT